MTASATTLPDWVPPRPEWATLQINYLGHDDPVDDCVTYAHPIDLPTLPAGSVLRVSEVHTADPSELWRGVYLDLVHADDLSARQSIALADALVQATTLLARAGGYVGLLDAHEVEGSRR